MSSRQRFSCCSSGDVACGVAALAVSKKAAAHGATRSCPVECGSLPPCTERFKHFEGRVWEDAPAGRQRQHQTHPNVPSHGTCENGLSSSSGTSDPSATSPPRGGPQQRPTVPQQGLEEAAPARPVPSRQKTLALPDGGAGEVPPAPADAHPAHRDQREGTAGPNPLARRPEGPQCLAEERPGATALGRNSRGSRTYLSHTDPCGTPGRDSDTGERHTFTPNRGTTKRHPHHLCRTQKAAVRGDSHPDKLSSARRERLVGFAETVELVQSGEGMNRPLPRQHRIIYA
ncbi:hypothetical protein STCU_10234 [Strigomonas culicis]|uniref:Uncharacterized protein n=1 Tax=Strigomonas culicis TaxID=28005 RepID=S9UU20_9TRYP|nr:hypothetical protein STCU_10234 [Strigomonas culicis]|eukprot:EPY18036.1 hypothetical protein STCU_10234 [Strigomonas culicis]